MTAKRFSVGDIVASKCCGRPFMSEVCGTSRDGFPAKLYLLVKIPWLGQAQWWPADWCERRTELEIELARTMEDVLRNASDTVWVGEGETLVDRMVGLGLYDQEVYEGERPWETA